MTKFLDAFQVDQAISAIYRFQKSRTLWLQDIHGHDFEQEKIPVGPDKVPFSKIVESRESQHAITTAISSEVLGLRYRFSPFAEQKIPKNPEKEEFRTISVCTVKDALTQFIALEVLNQTHDKKFSPCSYAYRPGHTVKQLTRDICSLLMDGWTWVVEADIRAFFDSLDHGVMETIIDRDLEDQPEACRALLKSFLTAPRLKARRVQNLSKGKGVQGLPPGLDLDKLGASRKRGVPQGGALSGFLANLYLDGLDKVFEKHAQYRLLRYADDFLILTRDRETAERAMSLAISVLAELKLEHHPKKTKIVEVNGGFDFVGHHFRHRLDRAPLVRIRNTTMRKRYQTIDDVFEKAEARDWCPCQLVDALNQKAIGIFLKGDDGELEALRSWLEFFSAINDLSQLRLLDRRVYSDFRHYRKEFRPAPGSCCDGCTIPSPERYVDILRRLRRGP